LLYRLQVQLPLVPVSPLDAVFLPDSAHHLARTLKDQALYRHLLSCFHCPDPLASVVSTGRGSASWTAWGRSLILHGIAAAVAAEQPSV